MKRKSFLFWKILGIGEGILCSVPEVGMYLKTFMKRGLFGLSPFLRLDENQHQIETGQESDKAKEILEKIRQKWRF